MHTSQSEFHWWKGHRFHIQVKLHRSFLCKAEQQSALLPVATVLAWNRNHFFLRSWTNSTNWGSDHCSLCSRHVWGGTQPIFCFSTCTGAGDGVSRFDVAQFSFLAFRLWRGSWLQEKHCKPDMAVMLRFRHSPACFLTSLVDSIWPFRNPETGLQAATVTETRMVRPGRPLKETRQPVLIFFHCKALIIKDPTPGHHSAPIALPTESCTLLPCCLLWARTSPLGALGSGEALSMFSVGDLIPSRKEFIAVA